MDADQMRQHLRETFAGVRMDEAGGDTFVTYDPDGDLPADRWHPFATIVTGDHHDTASDLGHPGVYRLNVGVTKQTYTAHLGAVPTARDAGGVLVGDADYTARDRLMPHPVYGNQHWISVINPGPVTLETAKHLLADAYDFAVRKHHNRESRART
jgi:hypothetical protein